jgi:Fibrobacter succinogenes major domain (Fib_succ_major).
VQKSFIYYWGFFFLLLVTLLSCQKQNQEEGQGLFQINFSLNSLKKALADTSLETSLSEVIVIVEDQNGKIIKTNLAVEIYNMNGIYTSKLLSLQFGKYKLTGFWVLDCKNHVVYASPVRGSSKAYLVKEPLSMEFFINKDNVTKVAPEVINVAFCGPEDLGYSSFNQDVATTFDLMVGVFIFDDSINNYRLTSSKISILSDTISVFKADLSANKAGYNVSGYDSFGISNKITLPEKFNTFTLEVSKPGYQTYTKQFSKEELKLYFRSIDKGPLIIILDKTPVQTTVTDIDGNVYHTITIGTQTWLLENLKTTHYRNGDPIMHVEDGATWWAQTTEAYCEYGDPEFYGRLYNWFATMDSRNICPIGYHVPSNAEWQTLVNYLGGTSIAGGKMKETGNAHWIAPNFGASNTSGFTALPAGFRYGGNEYLHYNYKDNLTWSAVFWTSTPNLSNGRVFTWELDYTIESIQDNDHNYKGAGFSVRCIQD